jgi:hypothetical protein
MSDMHIFHAERSGWGGGWVWHCDCRATGTTTGDPYDAWLRHLPAPVLSEPEVKP